MHTCCFTWADARVATVAVCGFGSWSLVFHFGVSGCHVKSPLFSNPLSNRDVLHDGRKHKTVVVFAIHCSPRISTSYKCATPHYRLPYRLFRWRRTLPFNGIERSLSRAVVITTKSLPVSATTFPTALSCTSRMMGKRISTSE